MLKITALTLLVSASILATGCGQSGSGGTDSLLGENTAGLPARENTSSQPPTNQGSSGPSGGSEQPPAASTKSVSLNWSIPSLREDGSPLDIGEIGGYEIYYFQDGTPVDAGQTHVIDDALTTSFTTPELELGLYYFAIASFDTNGVSSELSDPIAADLN